MIRFKRLPYFLVITVIFSIICDGCRPKSSVPPIFQLRSAESTGLDFNNQLTPTQKFNVLKYLYYYNGSGLGAGDFNNDGKIDLFFAANQVSNRLYLNEGHLRFKDVTQESKIPNDGGWSTGVSVVDINNDGLLDIYICRVGNFETLHSKNQLLICQGIDKNGVPFYKDEAHQYGLDFSGFSTQAVFFDYDGDGDLDMYLLNHSIHQNGTFGARDILIGKHAPGSGDRIFRNEGNGHFTDVTLSSGINSSVLGYGLGVNVADINLDGYPDVYVGNDFHENDYLYINQHNGTFKDELTDHLMHTSKYTMGVDIADANNDGYPDIISMDMLSSDPYILKRSFGDDEPEVYNLQIGLGYSYQYSRNNLQLNRRNGMFSEIGLYSGVAATDWSWSPLWMDFNNDGLKDLFISNGIPKRLNDLDYLNFVSNQEIQEKLSSHNFNINDIQELEKFPQIKIPNKFFENTGKMLFKDEENSIANNENSFSNGAVYADFDNDGDLDIVVNNIDETAFLYENTSNDKKVKPFISIQLKGSEKNINAVGAKIILFANGGIRTYENFPVHGFMSSMQIPIHIGLDKTKIDSLFIVWPDNTFQQIRNIKEDSFTTITYHKGLPKFNYEKITSYHKNPGKPVEEITSKSGILYKHKENLFPEFNSEPLIPRMLSTEGPALAVGDVNHDGLQDIFIGSAKDGKSAIFLQQPSGKFIRKAEPDLEKDSAYEDVSACFADVNKDGFPDLIEASGGNFSRGGNEFLKPRVYLNNGNGDFQKKENAFDISVNASCVVPYDFNRDGNTDLFIGARSVPGNYGETPESYLLQNDGSGNFKDVTKKYAKGLSDIGFVTSALWYDLDKDGDQDLIITLEWGGIVAFINNNGTFTRKLLTDKKGWWNFVLPVDLNNDGNIDLIAGNLGLNNRFTVSTQEPLRMYYNDFDDNGKKEQVLTYYLGGKEIEFANMNELEKQIPVIKKRFLYAKDFAKATLAEIFTKEKLASADTLTANYFSNAILWGKGNLNFSVEAMPWQAQLSAFKAASIIDANGDHLPDILLAGNYYENSIQMGRNDADFGTVLINKGGGKFDVEPLNGLQIKGQVRHISSINIGNKKAFILARNNDSTMVIQFLDR